MRSKLRNIGYLKDMHNLCISLLIFFTFDALLFLNWFWQGFQVGDFLCQLSWFLNSCETVALMVLFLWPWTQKKNHKSYGSTNLVEIRIPKKFSVRFFIPGWRLDEDTDRKFLWNPNGWRLDEDTDRKFLRNPNLNEITVPQLCFRVELD